MLFDRFDVIDVDTHVTEPPDTWSARMSTRWGDAVPRIERIDGFDTWVINGRPWAKPGNTAMAGFDGTLPDGPMTYADMHPGAWDPVARIAFMDEQHIRAQVLYPNIGGFGAGAWLEHGEPAFALECLRAYNDFQTDFASVARDRLLPIVSVPFWDVPAAVAEIERAVGNGHRGINFCNSPESYGQPHLWDTHWDPIWTATRDAGVPVNFHIGGGRIGEMLAVGGEMGFRANFSRMSSMLFADNLRCISDLIHGGVCHRFPDLDLVSVESGVGMIPGALEAFDWQWRNGGVAREHPEYDLLPSEYFRRQIYGCFWYEREAVIPALLAYPDNMLFETDFPHPTCQHPGPQTPAVEPETYADEALQALPDDVLRKVLVDTAARLYGVAGVREQLEAWLTDEVGEAVAVGDVRRTSAGFSRENWVFDATWSGTRHELIARRDPVGSVLETDRRVETAVLRALTRTEVPAPTLRWADVAGDRLGRPALIMDLARGTCDGFVLNGPAPLEDRVALAREIYDCLIAIHRIDWRTLDLVPPLEDPGSAAALRVVDHWESELHRVQLDPEPELAFVLAWLRANAPVNEVTTLVHGDFKPGNLLLEAGHVSAVLDWETAHLGDPHEDLGWVTNPLRQGEHRIPDAWEPQDLFDRWAEQTGLAVDPEAIRWWQVLANVKLCVIVLTGSRAFVEGRLDRIHQSPVRIYRLLLDQIGA